MKSILLILCTFVSISTAHAAEPTTNQVVNLSVTEKGFEPNSIDVKPGDPVTLKVTRKTDSTCATQIKIPSRKIKKDLPLNKTVTIDLGKLEKGEIRFACGMNMVTGKILVR